MTSLVKRPLPIVIAVAVCAAIAGEASAAPCPNSLSKTPTATQIAAISKAIAAGHAYQKHVVTEGQFKSTVTKATKGYALAELPIAATGTGAAAPTAAQKLEAHKKSVAAFAGVIKSAMGGFELICRSGRKVDVNRRAFYDDANNIIVIFNKLAADCGTSFRPDDHAQLYIESKGCGYCAAAGRRDPRIASLRGCSVGWSPNTATNSQAEPVPPSTKQRPSARLRQDVRPLR